MKASLILSFYNNLEYFKLVLAGLETQSEKDFEIIIADDGSSEEIVREIKFLVEKSRLKLIHIWHEDKGFRKNN